MNPMLTEGDHARLKLLEEAAPDDWCRATWAVSALVSLEPPMGHDLIDGNWQKLAGRECKYVGAEIDELRECKPEMRQFRLTKFGKEHPVVKPRRKSA